jgi:signal transduction histidine kinase
LVLEVRDDGKWLNQESKPRGGMGMHIMEYRAQLVGGTFRCDGGENGTVVHCQFPRP